MYKTILKFSLLKTWQVFLLLLIVSNGSFSLNVSDYKLKFNLCKIYKWKRVVRLTIFSGRMYSPPLPIAIRIPLFLAVHVLIPPSPFCAVAKKGVTIELYFVYYQCIVTTPNFPVQETGSPRRRTYCVPQHSPSLRSREGDARGWIRVIKMRK